MGARDDARDADVGIAGERLPDSPVLPDSLGSPSLPDLLELDLADLRTIQHPVLAEVLTELRERAGQPSEMLWGFNNSF
ncbi:MULTISPECIES: FxSxx-COOH cyclophane-containing RiPP peptide [Streptomyces]|uniref:FXSXX-COOH protein n=1 Tax=Streptomyces dengpaensis TaxID=2049881 RepID=A0ABM6SQ99_9ACTN|nr:MULTISPECIES: FxSxx-COOH cyclophane-containing RiPP peptide [Streptomyces]AVH56538.1 FXSXX-COOH protein [Streptomyces dengpaensis]PIB10437.1 FXSXX-COOH protein [Streptomyces sp. HG99]